MSTSAAVAESSHGAVQRAPARRWRREVAAFVLVYVVYSLARGLSTGSLDAALDNARWVVDVQSDLGLNVERAVQQALLDLPAIAVLNGLYLAAQLAVVPVGLVVVYRRRTDVYPLLRTTIIAAWAIAIPLYALFPTAPPRLAGVGILDTVSTQTPFALDSPLVTAFYNPVAAMPSLHASFGFAIGIAVATTTRNRVLKLLALLWGPIVVLVVIATGNHFVLDIALGLLVTVVAFAVAAVLHVGPVRQRALLGVAGATNRLACYPRPRLAPATPAPPEAPAGTLDGLRVAIVTPYSWDQHGGVRTHIAGLAQALRGRGLEVDVLAPSDADPPPADVIPIGPTAAIQSNASTARVAMGPLAGGRTMRALAAGRYDLVHAHEPLVPAGPLTALLWARVPVVGTFHSNGTRSQIYRRSTPFCRVAADRLAARIAVSESARACAAEWCPGDYEVIPNGVHLPPASALGAPRGGDRVVFVGRPDTRKGLPVLLTAVARMERPVGLDLVGVEPEDLQAVLDWLGLSVPGVRAHGRVDDARRLELLLGADVLCAPSLASESFGLVLAEGMAAGLPVVASDIAGYRDVLPPEGGVLVPPGDADALAGALGALLGDAELRARMGAAGRRAAERFSWERVADRVLAVYADVLARERAAAARDGQRPAAVAAS